jgi:hypothetical protein
MVSGAVFVLAVLQASDRNEHELPFVLNIVIDLADQVPVPAVSFLGDDERAVPERVITDQAKEFTAKRSFEACSAAAPQAPDYDKSECSSPSQRQQPHLPLTLRRRTIRCVT